ncbi:MAG: carbamate kinase [Thaumarchaeota archaeon]|nr:carbamate kinase [Nitrososphaerota archaeon]
MSSLRILVALGGNAILQHQEKGTAEEQFVNVRTACKHLVEIIEQGHRVTITHGNGPQVGDILLKDELAKDTLPPMPLDVCGAESQGMIGYMIQQSLRNELQKAGVSSQVATVLTEMVVDASDQAFKFPTKPIGPFYTSTEASHIREERGWILVEDSGRGYRRVVPSPRPQTVLQAQVIRELTDAGIIVIAAGGGGVPVVSTEDGFKGIEAVIDKDLSAAVLGGLISAEVLLILTDVRNVFLNYGLPNQTPLGRVTSEECRRYLEEGQFASGSMRPKMEAVVNFLGAGGERAIITRLQDAKDALDGTAGTTVVP